MSSIDILQPVDIEDEVRQALSEYLTAYVRPLPEEFNLPCVLVSATGGNTRDTIDTFNITLSVRAETDAQAFEVTRKAQGILEARCASQFGALRSCAINSLASWGTDPARPDLKLCTLTASVTAHRESVTITE